MRRAAFTLVELLVVIGLIGVLIAMLLPAMRKARMASQQTVCASNLRQMGAAVLMYVNENGQRLPLVVEPLWKPGGEYDLTVDPSNPATPLSFYNVTKKYLQDMRILICPSAVSGYPSNDFKMTYRVSAANNTDGNIQLYDDLFFRVINPVTGEPTIQPHYNFSLKYLNGRHYELMHVNARQLPFKLEKGVGDHYLIRDLVAGRRGTNDPGTPPHPNRQYNILRLDMSVTLQRDANFALLYP